MRNKLAHGPGAKLPDERKRAFATSTACDVSEEYLRALRIATPPPPDAEAESFRGAVVALHIIALEAHARCNDNLERRSVLPIYKRYGVATASPEETDLSSRTAPSAS